MGVGYQKVFRFLYTFLLNICIMCRDYLYRILFLITVIWGGRFSSNTTKSIVKVTFKSGVSTLPICSKFVWLSYEGIWEHLLQCLPKPLSPGASCLPQPCPRMKCCRHSRFILRALLEHLLCAGAEVLSRTPEQDFQKRFLGSAHSNENQVISFNLEMSI